MIGNFPASLNFNRLLFLKPNRFLCNQLQVLPDHRPAVALPSPIISRGFQISNFENKGALSQLKLEVKVRELSLLLRRIKRGISSIVRPTKDGAGPEHLKIGSYASLPS